MGDRLSSCGGGPTRGLLGSSQACKLLQWHSGVCRSGLGLFRGTGGTWDGVLISSNVAEALVNQRSHVHSPVQLVFVCGLIGRFSGQWVECTV